MESIRRRESDVVVVGCGIAGLCAAAAAAEAGAKVVILERTGKADSGGNSRWTEAYLRMKNVAEVSDDFETSLIENGSFNPDPHIVAAINASYHEWPSYVKAHPLLDPEIVNLFSSEAGPTLKWLTGLGARFESLPIYHLTMSAPRIAAVGGGQAILEALIRYLEKKRAEFVYETTAVALLQNEDANVIGVKAIDAERKMHEYLARSTVLACGGFEGNTEMLTRYLGTRAKHVRPVAPGGYYNKGEGIRMALDIGAAPAGEYSLFHAEPVDPRSRQAEGVVFVYTHGILVNSRGERFVDEAPGYPDLHYESICHRVADQADGTAYAVFDSTIEDVPNWRKSVRSDHAPITASSISELAVAAGIDREGLSRTVTLYNNACTKGAFSPLSLDGLSTQNLEPRKSNWARPISLAPYFAYPVVPAIVFTFGGLKVDTNARVLDCDGRPIRGLYAAGETVGIYHKNYTGATSVLRGAVFGRLAGTSAATERAEH